jgi:hypothetical protein
LCARSQAYVCPITTEVGINAFAGQSHFRVSPLVRIGMLEHRFFTSEIDVKPRLSPHILFQRNVLGADAQNDRRELAWRVPP